MGAKRIQGSFLPFHRLYLQNYEDALRNECGYSGYQPWVIRLKHRRLIRLAKKATG